MRATSFYPHLPTLVRFFAGLLLLCGLLNPAQAAITWAKNFGNSSNNTAYDVITDSSNNTYVTGGFSGATLVFGSTTLTRIGSNDAFVVKLDSSGTVLWAKNFGGSGVTMDGRSVGVDGSGNVFVGGNFSGGNTTSPAMTLMGTSDYFVIKLDSNGTVAWQQNFGPGSTWNLNRSMYVDNSGNSFIVGSMTANWTSPALTKIGSSDGFIVKLNNAGGIVWAKNFGGAGNNARSWNVTVDSAGNIFTSGYFNTANLTTPPLTLAGGSLDAYLLKLDSSGNVIWARAYGGAGASVTPGGLAADGAGNVYAGFHFSGANLTAPSVTKIGTQDALLLKIDSSGATTWARNYGNAGATFNTNGTVLAGSTVHLFGTLSGANLASPAITRYGSVDAVDIQIDNAGTVTGTRNYGGSGATVDTAAKGTVNSANHLLMAGSFSGANLTTPALTRLSTRDIMVLCEDCVVAAAVTTPTIPLLQPLSIAGVGTVPAIVNMSAGNGPTYMDSLVRLLSNTLGTPLQLVSQNAQGTVTLSGFKGGNMAFVPTNFRTGDSRGDGIYILDNGQYQAVINGQSLILAPALLQLDQLAALLPGAVISLSDSGVIIATYNGQTYAVQPGIAVQVGATGGGASLRMGSDGYYRFTDSLGNQQVLYPAFTEWTTLRRILKDMAPGYTLSMQMDGTGLLNTNGRNYTLVPDITLGTIPPERSLQEWWQESSLRYRLLRVEVPWGVHSTQGLTVLP